MSRFYTNPFVKDAPMEAAIEISEPHFSGYSVTAAERGVFSEWTREVRYSGGTVRSEIVKREATGYRRHPTWDGVEYRDIPGGRIHRFSL